MDGPALKSSRALTLGATVAKFLAAWGAVLAFARDDGRFWGFDSFVRDAIARVFAGLPSAAWHAEVLYAYFVEICGWSFVATLFFSSVFGVLGALSRMVARARVRAGQSDFLDPVRAWTASHPKLTRVLLAAPAVAWALFLVWPGPWELRHLEKWSSVLIHSAAPLALSAWGVLAMTRKGQRALLAPTIDGTPDETRFEIGPDEIAFDAVAVTPRTLAIVATFTALMLAIPLLIAKLPILELYRHGTSVFYLFGGYAAFAAIGALSFQKASRVAVGVDGVHVHGTSRARFFAYRDLDSARTNRNGDLELLRREKVVLRLQLHGEDAARRAAVLARINESIARVQEGKGAAAAQLVASSSKEDLARFAHGTGDYRAVTLSREQLWALVEGPRSKRPRGRRRRRRLARSADVAERARLRVAADHCAEPQVRVALEGLASEQGDLPEPAAPLHLPSVRP